MLVSFPCGFAAAPHQVMKWAKSPPAAADAVFQLDMLPPAERSTGGLAQ